MKKGREKKKKGKTRAGCIILERSLTYSNRAEISRRRDASADATHFVYTGSRCRRFSAFQANRLVSFETSDAYEQVHTRVHVNASKDGCAARTRSKNCNRLEQPLDVYASSITRKDALWGTP